MFSSPIGRKKEEDYRSERIVIHVTSREKENIKRIAAANGMNVSEFIRTAFIYKKFNNFFKEV